MLKKIEIFIVYESDHIDEAKIRAESGATIICLDFLLEKKCKIKEIPFIPLRNFLDTEVDEEEWWLLSHDIPKQWYRISAMDFFVHEGVRIAEAPEPSLQAHMCRLFYYVRIFIKIKAAYPDINFHIPNPSTTNRSVTECLAIFVPWAVTEAALMARLPGVTSDTHVIPDKYTFISDTPRSKFLRLYNFFINLLPRRGFKIYMSGYWPHAESLVPLLNDTEVILLEGRNFLRIPWYERLSHRMRVMYPHGPVSKVEEDIAKKIGNEFLEKWEDAQVQVAKYLSTVKSDLDWSPVIKAFRHIIIYSPRVIADINRLKMIMKREKPNLVLQMASVGGPQHYFLLMARVAKLLNIPSVELQHATVTIDPRSVFCRIETDYLLTYGDVINTWHKKIGNDKKRFISVGSPRFDKYVNEYDKGIIKGKSLFKELGLDSQRQVLLVAVPFSETYVSAVDSYLLADFFEAVRQVQIKTPGLQILFKCRNPRFIEVTKEYLKESFYSDWVITAEEDIFPLLCASDAVICNNSTVIYQAVLARKPLVLYPWKRHDSYHAQIYQSHIPLLYKDKEAIDVLIRIFADESYRQKLLSQQELFLKEYSFDGKSSKRTADLLRLL